MDYFFTDTHCHLAYMVGKPHEARLDEADMQAIGNIIQQTRTVGVTRLINIGNRVSSSIAAIAVAECFDGVYATAALHPEDEHNDWQNDMRIIEKLVMEQRSKKLVAVGECGLDFHYPNHNKQRQEKMFTAQIDLAMRAHLPLIIHTRDAIDRTFGVLDQFVPGSVQGVFHCFSETLDVARAVIDRGFMLGIGGPIGYPKNSALREIVRTIGLDHIVLETDAPFLPPQSMRGKQNSPVYIPLIAETFAQICGVSIDEVAARTSANAQKMFGL